jgi:succinate dehydrogenase / fumarate reductase cytochrome b subunit
MFKTYTELVQLDWTVSASLNLFRTTVGQKLVMGVTGAAMVGFVVAHMLGNLLIYAGAEALDDYGWFLQEGTHGLIWVVRLGLLAVVTAHVASAVALTRTNARARPARYQRRRRNQRTSYAALTMRYGGVVLVLFIAYHLAHLTLGWVHPDHVPGDVYGNVVRGLSVPWVAGLYLLAMGALGLHLYHGIASALQTLGVPGWLEPWRTRVALAVAVPVVVGNCSIPIAVMLGLVEL